MTPEEELAQQILQVFKVPPQLASTGIVAAINSTPTGNLVTVTGLADAEVICQSTGTFDILYATSGAALIGARVMVLTIAGQPFALTTYTIGV